MNEISNVALSTSLVSEGFHTHGMVLVNYRVTGGFSLHYQKFVFRGIRKKIRQRCRKTLNADEVPRFQRVFVDYGVRRTGNGKVLPFRVGFEGNVVVKFRTERGGSQIHVRRGGRSVLKFTLLIVHVFFVAASALFVGVPKFVTL